jgi:hypothetical protein
MAGEIRAARPAAGVVIFSYLNPILRYGLHQFADDAATAGVDGVLVTDLIVEEAGEYLSEMERGAGADFSGRAHQSRRGWRRLRRTPRDLCTPSRAWALPARSRV